MNYGQVYLPKKLETAKLNILFICSSLEPGKDGVGDYTRKLAGTLNRIGHKAYIIAINDRRMDDDIWQGKQCDENTEVQVLRLYASLPWQSRINTAKEFAARFNPDWISLQYVPFGYNLKGLPFNLGKKIKDIGKGKQWHIMFHELSVNKNESLKFKIWSHLQVRIIRSLMRVIKPALVNTNTELYRQRLEQMGYTATLLPLFSNIPHIQSFNNTALDIVIPEFIVKHPDDYIIGTLFGSFDFKSWNMCSLLDKFSYRFSDKRIIIVSLGRMSSGTEHWNNLKYQYPHILFLGFGAQDAAFISYWLSQYTDFGILTTLPELAGKSGSFMAFKEHGIPVVCKEKTPELEGISNISFDRNLIMLQDDADFVLPGKYAPISLLDDVAGEFINGLKSV